jgi:uncharacterized membrane protein
MLRLSSLVVLTVVAFGVAALIASALVANLASARTAGHFRVLSPVAAATATTTGEVQTQRRLSAAQQLRPTL